MTLVLRISTLAQDEHGDDVFLASGTPISEISDAGPEIDSTWTDKGDSLSYDDFKGWNVSFRVKHPGMPVEEIVTMDAVKLLKAL